MLAVEPPLTGEAAARAAGTSGLPGESVGATCSAIARSSRI
jgi:hypothetical protein